MKTTAPTSVNFLSRSAAVLWWTLGLLCGVLALPSSAVRAQEQPPPAAATPAAPAPDPRELVRQGRLCEEATDAAGTEPPLPGQDVYDAVFGVPGSEKLD